jgi:hypothetical protein
MRALPAARAHNDYAGGLLEHTVGVATICRELCQLHPRSPDLLSPPPPARRRAHVELEPARVPARPGGAAARHVTSGAR